MTTTANITDKEQSLLSAVAKGMNTPGNGWLHEIVDEVTKSTAGTLSSLISKNLVYSWEDGGCTFVELTEEGGTIVGLKHNGSDWEQA